MGETAAPDQRPRTLVAYGWGGTGVQNHDNTIGGIQPDVHSRGKPGNRVPGVHHTGNPHLTGHDCRMAERTADVDDHSRHEWEQRAPAWVGHLTNQDLSRSEFLGNLQT